MAAPEGGLAYGATPAGSTAGGLRARSTAEHTLQIDYEAGRCIRFGCPSDWVATGTLRDRRRRDSLITAR